MAQSKKQVLRHTKAERYEGGNEYIDHYLTGETWWIVQGPSGRRPVQQETKEQALDYYLDNFYLDEEEDDEEYLADCG